MLPQFRVTHQNFTQMSENINNLKVIFRLIMNAFACIRNFSRRFANLNLTFSSFNVNNKQNGIRRNKK